MAFLVVVIGGDDFAEIFQACHQLVSVSRRTLCRSRRPDSWYGQTRPVSHSGHHLLDEEELGLFHPVFETRRGLASPQGLGYPLVQRVPYDRAASAERLLGPGVVEESLEHEVVLFRALHRCERWRRSGGDDGGGGVAVDRGGRGVETRVVRLGMGVVWDGRLVRSHGRTTRFRVSRVASWRRWWWRRVVPGHRDPFCGLADCGKSVEEVCVRHFYQRSFLLCSCFCYDTAQQKMQLSNRFDAQVQMTVLNPEHRAFPRFCPVPARSKF